MTDGRPDPDRLLKQVQAEDEAAGAGRLKLFFGASPGVGKTYAMLEAARQRAKQGWDVVVGIVETHGRAETEALLQGFEVLPRREVAYRGVALPEFDLDAALARRPRLILVDELAHSNAEGLRHAKRWQDIEELLDAGIDVYTTLNVQHWESLNDVVAKITGVVVRETVPDTFLHRAHELELVDLAPDDLLNRLKDGKVYRGALAERAAENFFKPGNLIALRELALRHAAERVDAQMQAFKERHSIEAVWAVGERLLVGISSSPTSASLVRATARIAARLKAPWLAVHVETPDYLSLPAEEQARTVGTLRLAESLGAETVTLAGDNVTAEILTFARARNVTQIVLGKPSRPRWREWLSGSVVDNVARASGDINLHVINGVEEREAPRSPVASQKEPAWPFVMQALGVVAVTTLVCWPVMTFLDKANLAMMYLLGVVFSAYRFGGRAAVATSILSVLAFDFFFVPPHLTFAVSDTQYVLTFVVMLGVGLLISTIAGRLRRQTDALRERAERMRVLLKLTRDLSETPDMATMLATARTQLEAFYGWPVLVLVPGRTGLELAAGDAAGFGWTENEMSVGRWVFDRGQMAGAGSDTLSASTGLYLPMIGRRSTVGVLGLKPSDRHFLLAPDRLQLLESFASVIGGALESTRMSEEIGRNEAEAERHAIGNVRVPAPVSLKKLLSPEKIVFLDGEISKEEIIRILLGRMPLANQRQALRAIMEREKAGPTTIGSNISIPHARLPGIDVVHAVLGIVRQAQPQIWIVFVSPAKDPAAHLTFLAGIAKSFANARAVEDVIALLSEE